MKAPEITEELKNDIQVVQMRSALDPKHFYKRNEMKTIPKYFEVSSYGFLLSSINKMKVSSDGTGD